jgi:hypothetical protein
MTPECETSSLLVDILVYGAVIPLVLGLWAFVLSFIAQLYSGSRGGL